MAAQGLPPVPRGRWIDTNGVPLQSFFNWVQALSKRVGGSAEDKVDLALTTAQSAASGDAEIVPGLGLRIGGKIGDNAAVALYAGRDILANLPTTGVQVGDWAYCTNARNSGEGAGAGTGSPVCWSGSAWRIPGVATTVTV